MRLLRVAPCSRCSSASHDARSVGDDEAGVLGENLARHVERGGEEQPVAMQPIIDPFPIGAEIRHRRLDLDNPDFSVGAECDQVGTPTGRERQLAQHRKSERMEEPRGATRDPEGGRRLPAVDGQYSGERARAHGKQQPRQRHAGGGRG
jgi:hypothetical protein